MPRHVDPEQRRREVVEAAVDLLSEGGLPNLSFGNLAKRLGGSMTRITHYFANREAVIEALLEEALAEADDFIASLAVIPPSMARLRLALEWFLPIDEESMRVERARIALIARREVEPAITVFLERLDPAMRRAVECGLEGLTSDARLDDLIDLVRVWTSGVVLSAVERPELWPPQRQLQLLDLFVTYLPLHEAAARE